MGGVGGVGGVDLLQGLTPHTMNHQNGSPEEEVVGGAKEEGPPHCSTISFKKSDESSFNHVADDLPIIVNGNAKVQSFSCNGHQDEGESRESSPDLQRSPRSSPTKQKPPVVSKKPHISSLPPYSPRKLNGRVASLEEEFRRSSEKIPYHEEEFRRSSEKVLSQEVELSRPSEKIPYNDEDFTSPSEKVSYQAEESSRPSEVDGPTKRLSDWSEDVQTETLKASSSPDQEVCTNGDAHEDEDEDEEDDAEDASSCTSESSDSKEDEAGESQLNCFLPTVSGWKVKQSEAPPSSVGLERRKNPLALRGS